MSLELLQRYGLNPKRPEAIDSSMLKDFIDCESYFYLRHILGLRKKFRGKTEDSHLDWGTCWHKATELLALDGPIAALTYINTEFPDSVDPTQDKHKRSKERMLKIFLNYVEEKWPEIQETYELIRAEQFFDIFDEDLGIRWSGRIDKLRRNRKSGKIVVWDYKTTSNLSQHYFTQHEMGFQFPGYVWAADRMFTEPVEELCLDVLHTLAASHTFYRRTFRYTVPELHEWASNVRLILDRMNFLMDNFLDQPERWVKNKNNCISRYHKVCPFMDIHSIAPIGESRLAILEDDYYEDRWDPINAMEEVTLN